ncbi:hypothetical protein NKR23_g6600 [Pleurostoma richardsiae]|uniref:Heterokaryon incompatibility domain-containing protein n=1 Tax=Pleurostoma richardsiae TaxID=41990 RepID=A0AA38VE50_9PEZI|nr:hypothetical protein NKR23_g6600 [Pleurostoma richardsiae]
MDERGERNSASQRPKKDHGSNDPLEKFIDPDFMPKVLVGADYTKPEDMQKSLYDFMTAAIINSADEDFDPKELRQIQFSDLDANTSAVIDGLMHSHNRRGRTRIRPFLHPNYSYEALSYVWGLSTEGHTITLDDRGNIPVTDNLFAALRRLRNRDMRRVLWVDSLCINQQSIEERNEQVQMMGRIYNSATSVVVWLGDTEVNTPQPIPDQELVSEEASDSELDADEESNGDKKPEDPLLTWQKEILNRTLTTASPPWWTRAWVTQELVLAYDIRVAFGPIEVDWETFYSDMSSVWTTVSKLGRLISLRQNRQYWQYEGSIGETALLTRYCDATDLRDKVYSLLSLVKPAQAQLLKPNYALDPAEIFTQATFADIWGNVYKSDVYTESMANYERRYINQSPRYPVFSSYGDNTVQTGLRPDRFRILNWAKPTPNRIPHMPSWAVDFSDSASFMEDAHFRYHHERWTFDGNGNLCEQAMVKLSPDKRRLTVRGVVFDHVKHFIGDMPVHEYKGHLAEISNSLAKIHSEMPTVNPYNLATGTTTLRTDDLRVLKRPNWVLTKTGHGKIKISVDEYFEERLGHWDPDERPTIDWASLDEAGLAECQHEGCRCGPSRIFKAWNTCVGLPKHAQNYISPDRSYISPWDDYCISYKGEGKTEDPLREEDILYLLTTTCGFFGLARETVRPGDVIALFYGSDVPVVLRPDGDHYTYEGRAWINGIMMGELWNIYEDPMLEQRDFEIW